MAAVKGGDQGKTYILDTSSLIRAWTEAYPRRRFVSLWDRVEQVLIPARRLIVPKVVEAEIGPLDVDLRKWLMRHKQTILVSPNGAAQALAAQITHTFQGLVDMSAMRLQADPFVIAMAHGMQATVVTEEGGKKRRQHKIPHVCKHYGVACVNTLGMLDGLDWSF